MKFNSVLRISAAACGALFAGTVLAQSHDGPRVMMYWQLPLDGVRVQPASFGLRLDSAPLRVASLERLPVFDLRRQAQHTTLHLNGMPAERERQQRRVGRDEEGEEQQGDRSVGGRRRPRHREWQRDRDRDRGERGGDEPGIQGRPTNR